MTEIVLGVLATVFCVAGAVSLIHWIALKVASCDSEDKKLFAVLLDGKDADIRLQMALQVLSWNSCLREASVLAVDGGMTDSMAEYCRIICRNNRITFIEKDEAENILPLFKRKVD